MRIGIDVRYLSHGLVGGVHTYVEHFVPALARLVPEHRIFLYADTKRPFELDALPENVAVRFLPWHSPLSSVWHDFMMRRWMARDRVDVAHFPANYGFGPPHARTVVTLHDAMNIMPLPEILGGLTRGGAATPRRIAMSVYLHACSRLALRQADLIFTDSAHAGEEIARQSGVARELIVPIHLAPAPELKRVDDAVVLAAARRRFTLPDSFILADALKNPGGLVAAWRMLPDGLRRGRRIVFFSRRPDPLPVVTEAVANGEALLLVRPTRFELTALYSLADAFVFPSWLEGFGLPVLEAMVCGAPVIASDRGSIPEVVGGAGRLVDAENAAALAAELERVLGDEAEAERLRRLGFARSRQFSWPATARMILNGYERALTA